MTFAVQRHCWSVRLWRPHERRMASPSSFSRRLCVAAVTTAFVIGVVVGILLPLYMPTSSALSLSLQAARGNATETNSVIANGPWRENARGDVLQGSEDAALGMPREALSWPELGTPPAKLPAQNTDDGVLLQDPFLKFGGKIPRVVNNDASRNRAQHGPGPSTERTNGPKDPSRSLQVIAKKHPSLTDLLFSTSGKQLKRPLGKFGGLGPSVNATSTGQSYSTGLARAPVTTPATEGLPQVTRPLPLPRQRLGDAGHAAVNRSEALAEFDGKGPLEALVDGIYWSDRVERSLPEGFSQADIAAWTSFAGSAPVVKVVEGCGRMQNRLLVFDNGTKSCCRYRQNNDQIQGEIFSFYLAQLLGLRGLPPATLGLLHGHEGQWRTVRGQLTLAQWNEQKPVVMTKFLDDLVPAHIPRHFRGDGPGEHRRLHPLPQDLSGLGPVELREVAQWSDLVVFDYLTANLDRVVNNMYNKQWNPDMMAAPAHNLAKVAGTGLLVFLDNESGLLHGYRLLDKYESYHSAMLEGLCVFRRSTAKAVLQLHYAGDVGQRLKMALMESQPQMAEWLPLLPDKSVKILRERLARVARQILQCEHLYMNASSSTDSNLIGSHDSLTRPSVDAS